MQLGAKQSSPVLDSTGLPKVPKGKRTHGKNPGKFAYFGIRRRKIRRTCPRNRPYRPRSCRRDEGLAGPACRNQGWHYCDGQGGDMSKARQPEQNMEGLNRPNRPDTPTGPLRGAFAGCLLLRFITRPPILFVIFSPASIFFAIGDMGQQIIRKGQLCDCLH